MISLSTNIELVVVVEVFYPAVKRAKVIEMPQMTVGYPSGSWPASGGLNGEKIWNITGLYCSSCICLRLSVTKHQLLCKHSACCRYKFLICPAR